MHSHLCVTGKSKLIVFFQYCCIFAIALKVVHKFPSNLVCSISEECLATWLETTHFNYAGKFVMLQDNTLGQHCVI